MTPLEIAIQEIGKEETPRGSNWGPDVQKYLHSVGINFPASWCMAFVYYCVDQACHISGTANPLYKTGGVLAQWNNVINAYKHPATLANCKPGAVFIMDLGKGLGHTGFIENVVGEDVHTIEGNTNDSGSREGYEVCRRVRHVSNFKGIIIF